MAYEELKQEIRNVVKTNGNQEITGANMQSTLLKTVDAIDNETQGLCEDAIKDFVLPNGAPLLVTNKSVLDLFRAISYIQVVEKVKTTNKYYLTYLNNGQTAGFVGRVDFAIVSEDGVKKTYNILNPDWNGTGVRIIETPFFDDIASFRFAVDLDALEAGKTYFISNIESAPYYNYPIYISPANVQFLGMSKNSKFYNYEVNIGMDYPFVKTTDPAVDNLIVGAEVILRDETITQLGLAYINRTATTEGMLDNAIQLRVFRGAENELITLKNNDFNSNARGVKRIKFYAEDIELDLFMNLDYQGSYPAIYNENPEDAILFDICNFNYIKKEVEVVKDSKFYNYEANIGKDYPMTFAGSVTEEQKARYNKVVKNIKVNTNNKLFSYELGYVNAQATGGLYDNTIGVVCRGLNDDSFRVVYYKELEDVENKNPDFIFVHNDISGDIVTFYLDLSELSGLYDFSNQVTSILYKKMFLSNYAYAIRQADEIQQRNNYRVKMAGGILTIYNRVSENKYNVYVFQKCMFNEIFTFYRVGNIETSVDVGKIDDSNIVWLNISSSDNIGPLSVGNGGWTGANHGYRGEEQVKTAKTNNYSVLCNGVQLQNNQDVQSAIDLNVVIQVENTIYDPTVAPQEGDVILTSELCTEIVNYKVLRDSIEVNLTHNYKKSAEINTYYGMQSMANFETEILTANGEYVDFTNVDLVGRFYKVDYPKFNRFIEKSGNKYQSNYLMPVGLGAHEKVGQNDFVFTRETGKGYHRLMANTNVVGGDVYSWRGLYTWMVEVEDNENYISYMAYSTNGKLLFIDTKKQYNGYVIIPSVLVGKDFEIVENIANVIVGDNILSMGLKIDAANASTIVLRVL